MKWVASWLLTLWETHTQLHEECISFVYSVKRAARSSRKDDPLLLQYKVIVLLEMHLVIWLSSQWLLQQVDAISLLIIENQLCENVIVPVNQFKRSHFYLYSLQISQRYS